MKAPPKVLFLHPTGNPNSKNAALAFKENELLAEVITALYIPNGSLLRKISRFVPNRIKKQYQAELDNRTWKGIDDTFLMGACPLAELLRIILCRFKANRFLGIPDTMLTDRIFYSSDRFAAKRLLNTTRVDAVYAFEDSAAVSFACAKKRGLLCLYDLPIFFYRKCRQILAEEAAQFPEFAPILAALHEPAWKIERKEMEARLADYIFVPSLMTKKSLTDFNIPPEKIIILPYGAPVDYFAPAPKNDATFRALFVGQIGPRKGVHYLLKAWDDLRLKNAELRLVGGNWFPEGYVNRFDETIRYFPPVPHVLLAGHFQLASVFVFPSLVEGLSLALLEAMACGIPVVTTPNSGGADIITDGVEGFIIPIRDIEALKQKLEWSYSHPEALAEMGRAARKKAEELSWDLYRKRLGNCVRELLAR